MISELILTSNCKTGINYLTKLTFTNDKAFDSADGTEMSTIDQVFKAGDKVVGEGDITVFADSPCFSTTLYTGTGTNLKNYRPALTTLLNL